MRQSGRSATAKSETRATPDQIVKDIRRATRKHHSAEEKFHVVLEGLLGEHYLAELCRQEGIAESLDCSWPREFPETGKRRLARDTARAATSDDVEKIKDGTITRYVYDPSAARLLKREYDGENRG